LATLRGVSIESGSLLGTNLLGVPVRCSNFCASFQQFTDIPSHGQIEVFGSRQMTLVRNLNLLAFLIALGFLAAIVVGVI
jgi:hypothetical protein